MIIKSMSRKQATFGQLVDYMEDGRQDKKYTLKHNLYASKPQKIKEEFEENARFVAKRKNGVYMYHEVLSITKSSSLTDDQQKEILREIAIEYIGNRANNNLAYAVLHDDKKDNLHYHFLISSNEVHDSKKHRLSKQDFDKFKKNLETRVLSKYPELEQKEIINKTSKEKLSNKGAELKRRTGKTNQRDSVKDRLKTVFSSSKDKQSFFDNMSNEKLEIYVRGNNIGVIDKETGRKHRLKSLGMMDDFNKVSAIVEGKEKPKQKNKDDNDKPGYNKTESQKDPNTKENDFESKQSKTNYTDDSDYTLDDFEDFENFEDFDLFEENENLEDFKEAEANEKEKNTVSDKQDAQPSKEDIIEARRNEMRKEREQRSSSNDNSSSNSNKRWDFRVYDVVSSVKSNVYRITLWLNRFNNNTCINQI